MTSSIISIDWLQLYCDLHLLNYTTDYEVKLLDYGTRHFEVLEEIYLQGSLFATVQRQPRSEILKEHTGIIKFHNSILYSSLSQQIILQFLSTCEIYVINITRIDIAIDFRKFKNGLLPKSLIKGFMNEKYLKNGRGKYTVIGDQKNVLDVSYLRFGTKSSDVNVYLYNKSLEMKQQVYKEYIAESWRDLDGSPMADVWRLEFSLKAKACTYLDSDTGEIEQIDIFFLSNDKLKKRVVSALVDRYFEFKINDGQKNKTRMKNVDLFDFEKVGITNRYFPKGTDIHKRDKILMKNLYCLDKEIRNVPEVIQESIDTILCYMKESEFLDTYFEQKQSEWDKTPFRI